ncbi:hypothetical protein GGF46_003474 [Coemansia sp. RSA 552]|nr:hypothetical protein GGF46_003474 [Coemansia sp. RSA 552]
MLRIGIGTVGRFKPAAAAAGMRQRGVRLLSTVSLEFTRVTPDRANHAAPPLVILHGLFGSKQNWRAISKQLAHTLGCSTYSIDLRNHGDSPHQAPHSYTAMSGDIVRFIEEHGLQKPILIGHSMGGKVVMHTALQRPELVSQLIVDDMVPVQFGLAHDFAAYVDKLADIEGRNITSQKEMDVILAEVEPDLGVRQFLLTNMKKVKDPVVEGGVKNAYRSRIPLQLLGESLRGVMAWEAPDHVSYAGPTLFIAGTRSPYIKPKSYPIMKRYFPNYQLAELDTGHWVHAEKPLDFIRIVEKFITEH